MPRSARYPEFPSVTEILAGVGLTREYPDNAATLAARRRGTVLHKAIELHHADRLDIESLDPRVRPYFDAYLRFLDETGHKPLHSELEVVSQKLGVVGHIDRVAAPTFALFDFKTTEDVDLLSAKRQLAGYEEIWTEQCIDGEGCYVLQLRRDGRYTIYDLSDNTYDRQVFRAAVMVFYEKGKK